MVSPGLMKRIEKFRSALFKLRTSSKYSLKEMLEDFKILDSVERNLEIAIQALIDIGNYIISKLNIEAPMRYKDIPLRLFSQGLISKEEFKLFSKIIGFGHILVHLYADVVPEKIYEILQNDSMT